MIDVPDKVYEMVMNTGTYGCYRFNSTKAIMEGTPLPEGHESVDTLEFRTLQIIDKYKTERSEKE